MNLNDKIKTEKFGMTHNQLQELRSFFVERYVDNMTTEDLAQYVYDTMMFDVEKQTDQDFLRDARDYWDDGFDDVVEEIKEYANCDFKKPLRESFEETN